MERAGETLQAELSKLIPVQARLAGMEKRVQEQIVVDAFRGQKAHANMLAKELVVIRRVSKLLADLKFVYETLILRIGTIKDYGELLNAVGPAVASLRGIRSDLATVTPAARETFSSLSDLFSNTLVSLDIVNETPAPPSKAETRDALEILDEASRMAEQELRRKLPTLPEIMPKRNSVKRHHVTA